jgi:hypothetical protein
LDLGLSTIGSLVFLVVGDWVSRIQIGEKGTFSDDENGV